MLFIALAAVTALEVLAIAAHRISRMAVVFVIALTQFIGLAVAYYGGLFGASIPIRFFFAGIFLSCLPAAVLSAYLLDGVRSARGLILLLLLGFGGFGLTWAMGLTFAPKLGFSPVESLPPSAAWLVFASATMAEVLGLVTVLALHIALGRRLHLPHWARTLCALALAPLANSLLVFLASLLLPQARGYYDLLGIAVIARAAMGVYMTPGVLVFLRAFPPALETDMASIRTRDVLAQFLEVRRTLGEVEARYRALFEAAPNAIVLFGQDGIIREANARAAEMAGCRGNALVGMPVWELVTVADAERGPEAAVKARMKEVQPGGFVRLESMVQRADGTTLPVEINLARIGDAASLYVAVAHDLTRRKRDQEQLEKQISELNALAEMSHIAAVARDMPRLLKASVDRLGDLVEADGCWITLWRGDKQQAVPAAACGPDHEGFRSLPAISSDEGPSMTSAALSAGHPIVIQNFPESQYSKPRLVMGPAIQSVIVLPLIADERKLGAIVVGYHRPHAFGQEETTTLERAANVIALAIAKIHLLDETQERLRHVLVLNRIAEKLSATLDAREIFQTLADEIIETLRVRQCAALEGSEEKRSLTVTAGRLLPEVRFLIGHQFPADDFPTLESLGWTRGPIILDDANNDERLAAVRPLLEQGGVRSLLVVPLEARGQMLGALALDTTGREPFSPSELDLIVSIGHYAAAALENACLYAETVEREQVAESLRHVGAALASTLDYDEILDRILDNLTRVVQCDAANIQLIQRGAAQVIRSRGYEKLGLAVQMEDLTLSLADTPLLQQIVETRQPLFVPDIRQEPRWKVPSSWGERPQFWRSWAGAPVIARGEVIGFVNADSAEPGTYTERHAELLAIFANQAATALENARLYEQAQRRLTELTAIYQVGQRLQTLHTSEALAQEVIDALGESLGYDHGSVMLVEEATGRLVTFGLTERGRDAVFVEAEKVRVEGFGIRLGVGITGSVAQTGKSVRVGDVSHEPHYVAVRQDIRSELCVPMRVGDKVIGVINVESTRPDAYSDSDQRVLETIGTQVAVAIQNARLYEDLEKAYRQVKEAQEEAMRAERLRALGQMASGIAHDFNNVLMPIMGYLELVLENPDLPEEVRSDVERARRSALAASGIVARLREFYRPREAAEAFGPVDMSKVVLEAIDLTRPRWRDIPQEQGTVIDIHPELGDLPPVHGDANALRDMLTNLLINAVDAMPSGGVITIRTQRESTRALLTVSDTGVGMNAEARQRAFEPFFSTKGSRGTGLGLAVCYGTVQRHGGTIDLTSEPGIGTTFLIRLPLSSGTRPIGRDPDLPALPPLTILVVDDEEPVLTVVSRMLMRAGHSVIAASGGQEGIDQFRPGLVDVVITDLGMPGVTGRELARVIKSHSPQTPIILLTGWGAKVGAEPGAPEEMDAILSKPVNSNELHRALAKVLGLLKEE